MAGEGKYPACAAQRIIVVAFQWGDSVVVRVRTKLPGGKKLGHALRKFTKRGSGRIGNAGEWIAAGKESAIGRNLILLDIQWDERGAVHMENSLPQPIGVPA
jgi:hypothetical protein